MGGAVPCPPCKRKGGIVIPPVSPRPIIIRRVLPYGRLSLPLRFFPPISFLLYGCSTVLRPLALRLVGLRVRSQPHPPPLPPCHPQGGFSFFAGVLVHSLRSLGSSSWLMLVPVGCASSSSARKLSWHSSSCGSPESCGSCPVFSFLSSAVCLWQSSVAKQAGAPQGGRAPHGAQCLWQ